MGTKYYNKMKLEKNKLVFGIIILLILIFIGGYSMQLLHKDEDPTLENNRIPVPKLEDQRTEYDSKLDAINDLKEVRETNAPSIYDERLLDSAGVYDPDLLDKQKMHMVDSIYNEGRINYAKRSYRNLKSKISEKPVIVRNDSVVPSAIDTDFNKYHAAFFHEAPELNKLQNEDSDSMIYAIVNGTQVVKKDFRLELQLTQPAVVSGRKLPKHARLYGFVSFKPNRVMIHITNIEHQEVSLKAFDFQDGNEGVHIVNNFRAEATKELVNDAMDQINIPSVPSTGVLKSVFQRSNRNVKVTITDNYKLILKPKL